MKLAHSPLTDHVYVVSGKKKTAVTNDFIHCVVSRWAGMKETIHDLTKGKTYEISVREIETKEEAKV